MEGSGLSQYKVVMITLDDLIFNLNQIRYDFGNILYHKEFNDVSYKEFTKHFGTSNSLYSFIDDQNKQKVINDKIETFLYSEKNYKNIIMHENADEVLKLLQRQEKTTVVMTSHSYQLAKVLLKNQGLYPFVDQVLGISEFSDKWPSIKLFNALVKYYKIQPEEMLVITSFNSIFECLEHTNIHRMYVGNPAKSYIDSSLRPTYTVANNFDILQFALYGKYVTNELFNPILGFDSNMSEEEKSSRYAFLQDKYKDQPEILTVVEGAYYGTDLAHTTSFDTKEFKLAYEMLDSEKNNEPIEVIKEVKQTPKKKKKKKIDFKPIIFDIIITVTFTCLMCYLHILCYPYLAGKLKEVYDSIVLGYPMLANALFRWLTSSIGWNGRGAYIFHSALLTTILYLVIDFIISKFKSK